MRFTSSGGSNVQRPNTVGGIVAFVGIVVLISSVILSGLSEAWSERKAINVALDKKKNILASFGIETGAKATVEDVDAAYAKVSAIVVNDKGEEIEGDADAIDKEVALLEQYKNLKDGKLGECQFVVYILKDDAGEVQAYALPMIGEGLWGKMLGYISVGADANTVKGISYYKHQETPGLGAEIEKPWFRSNFVGQKVYDEAGILRSVSVVKGKARDRYAGDDLLHFVDGISGATITARGVTDMLKAHFEAYHNYFSKLRK